VAGVRLQAALHLPGLRRRHPGHGPLARPEVKKLTRLSERSRQGDLFFFLRTAGVEKTGSERFREPWV